MNDVKKKYESPVDVPKEIDDYWHARWAEYMNEHYREKFLEVGLAGYTFTEKAPDTPNGAGCYHFGFRSDGAFEFRDEEGDAVVEWDTYELAYRALGDESYNPEEDITGGRCRYTKNPENFLMAQDIIFAFREALKVAIKDAEKKFGVQLPKYW
jgi:hypothetical protein